MQIRMIPTREENNEIDVKKNEANKADNSTGKLIYTHRKILFKPR